MTLLTTQPFAVPGGTAPRRRGFLQRPDCQLYYEVTGQGPALIFAHGLGGNYLSWWQQVAAFCPHYSCVTFSHRGFAPSSTPPGGPDPADYAEDLKALIGHLALENPVFIGQSMGGWTGIDFALAYPGMLQGLVLSATCGAIDPQQSGEAGRTAYEAWRPGAEAALRQGAAAGVHPAVGLRAAREQPALHLLYRAMDELSTELDKDQMRDRLFNARVLPAQRLSAIATPTLWVNGTEDVVFASPLAPHLAGFMPQARHAEVPDCGHSPYFERPALFNALLAEFLDSLGV